jgi:hypothetical protein
LLIIIPYSFYVKIHTYTYTHTIQCIRITFFQKKIKASDEKLFWHGTDIVGLLQDGKIVKHQANDMQEGRPCIFLLRNRGGLRCAIQIILLDFGCLRGYSTLKGELTGIAVDQGKFVLFDFSKCPLLANKVNSINIYLILLSLSLHLTFIQLTHSPTSYSSS